MADVCLLLLEDGSGFLLLEDKTTGRLELEVCPQPVGGELLGGWAEPAIVRENETDLVIAVLHSLRRRRRLTVG